MTYTAIVKKQGTLANTWIITPKYTRIDGQNAIDLTALSADGIVPKINDIVLCTESLNDAKHNSVRIFDNNGGASPVIVGVFSQLITTNCDITIQGKTTLGTGNKKMVLGDDLATWASKVDAALSALYAWGATGTGSSGSIPPFPGTPALSPWQSTNLSDNHKLD